MVLQDEEHLPGQVADEHASSAGRVSGASPAEPVSAADRAARSVPCGVTGEGGCVSALSAYSVSASIVSFRALCTA